LVLHVLVTHRLVNFSSTGVVAVLEKPDFHPSEPVAPDLASSTKKACIAREEVRGQDSFTQTDSLWTKNRWSQERGLGHERVLGYCSDEVFVKSRVPGESLPSRRNPKLKRG
jgi:hypothetical protein